MPPLRLEVFEAEKSGGQTTVVTDLNAMEEARLASYEQGYTAGWEDSVSAQRDEAKQMAADLAHNLQSLNFTYYEARAHILKALEPLLREMVDSLLPEVARGSLATIVANAILPLAETAADGPITLLFNPAARAVLAPLVEQANGLPLTLVEEPTLGEGQVFLQLGDVETQIDLDGALTEIRQALADFFTLSLKDPKHG